MSSSSDLPKLPTSEILFRRYRSEPFRGFLDAADPSGVWEEIRTEAGVGDGWAFHAPEVPPSTPEMLAFCRIFFFPDGRSSITFMP
jgi:hypothetical protein